MSVTYGFYNALNHDRRYDAVQMSSIFDGIIGDGVYMSIGNRLTVKANSGMTVAVDTGRAWFDHTWTLNDSPLLVGLAVSEIILNRIDAVVLEVNAEESVRANTIKAVKGKPATNPERPAMVNTGAVHQYPLAYISVRAGATEIRQADITNMVGTSSTPFVTGVVQTINIDSLVAQWGDQWQRFYEAQVADMERANIFWKEQWATWFQLQTADIERTNASWKQQWERWFYGYTDRYSAEMADWKGREQTSYLSWFQSLQAVLSNDAAANLASEVINLRKRTETLELFSDILSEEHEVHPRIYDIGYRAYDNLRDSSGNEILDSGLAPIVGGTRSSEPILDSNGNSILGRVIFVVK